MARQVARELCRRSRRRHLAGGPQRRGHRTSLTGAPPARRRGARLPRRRTDRTSSPTIWPVSWPLPAITSTSPASQLAHGGADRLGAVADLARRPGARPGSRARIAAGDFAARIVVGDDDAVGEAGARSRPSSGRLPRSRSPPQPNTTTSCRSAWGRSARKHRLQRVGRVGVIDIDRRAGRRWLATCSSRPGRRRAFQAPPWRRAASAPVPIDEAERAQRVHRLEAAGQRQLDIVTRAEHFQLQALAVGRRQQIEQDKFLRLGGHSRSGDDRAGRTALTDAVNSGASALRTAAPPWGSTRSNSIALAARYACHIAVVVEMVP